MTIEKSGRPGEVDRKTARALEWLNERSPTLAALSDMATAGIAVLVSAGEWISRSIAGGTGITVTNGSGVAGNPTVALANTAVTPGSYTLSSVTVDAQGRLTSASSAPATGVTAGSYKSPSITVNAQGQVTAASHGPAVLADFYSSVLNSGTSETDLFSHTLTAGQLSANGQKILAKYGGNLSASSAPTIKLYFGGTQIFSTGALGIGGATAYWSIDAMIVRSSATEVRYAVALFIQLESPEVYNVAGSLSGLTLSNSNVIKITGQSGAGGEIAAVCGFVEFKPAA